MASRNGGIVGPIETWRAGAPHRLNLASSMLIVLEVEPQATVAQIAVSAGVGRSTAGKLLGQLESDGEVRRTEGGRDGNRRLPGLWSLRLRRDPR